MLKFRSKILLVFTTCLWMLPNPSQATIGEMLYNEIVFLRGIELGAGGRGMALGGAYRGISDDLSALYWNPAGLASIRRIEVGLGISQALTQDEAQISTETVSNELSRTRLNEVGLAFPFPTYRGSLVFALGYHQVSNFDAFGTFTEETEGYSFTGDELESGRLGLWSLGMAIDVSPMISTGISLRYWTGYDDYSWNSYSQEDSQTWSSFDQSLDLDLSGFNAMIGVLARVSPWLRIGATLESPLKLSIDEDYAEIEEVSEGGVYEPNSFSASYEYKVSRSWRGGLGAAGMIGPIGLSADAVLNDWSQINFSGEPPYEELDRDQANREITRYLQPTIDLHFGVEFWVPSSPVRLQAGYAWLPSPFEGDEVISDKNVITGGISTILDESLLVQASLSWADWERSIGGWGEDLQLTHLLLSLSYRF